MNLLLWFGGGYLFVILGWRVIGRATKVSGADILDTVALLLVWVWLCWRF